MISNRRSAFLIGVSYLAAADTMLSAGPAHQSPIDEIDQSGRCKMIVLKGSRGMFGLPEASPFVTKTDIHLKMAGVAYTREDANPNESPKGQIPFIVLDDGQAIADSTFIRFHIEQEYGVDLDEGLDPVERATALAVEMLCEHQLAPAVTWFRWMVPENFAKGPAHFFDGMPEGQREAVIADVLERVKASFVARGVGRHSIPEITALATRAFKAVGTIMGDKPYLMGDRPCGADAFVFACLIGAMTPYFDTPVRDAALKFPALVAYVSRMVDRFYPAFEWDEGIDAETIRRQRAAA
jgi:glutathione S-transferase